MLFSGRFLRASALVLFVSLLFAPRAHPAFPSAGTRAAGSPGTLTMFTPGEDDLERLRRKLLEGIRPALDRNIHAVKAGLHLFEPGSGDPLVQKLLSRAKDPRLPESGSLEGLLDLAELYLAASSFDGSFQARLERTVERIIEGFGAEQGGVASEGIVDVSESARLAYIIFNMKSPRSAHREFARRTLDLIVRRCILPGGAGVSHGFSPGDGVTIGDGYLIDNARAGLALLSGHRATNKEEYLDAALDVAGFISRNLYDSKVGGFMKRNSVSGADNTSDPLFMPLKDFYENAVAALFMAEVFEFDRAFASVADPAIGYLSGEVPYIKDPFNGAGYLVEAYKRRLAEVQVPELFAPAESLPGAEGGFLVLLLLAFTAGVLSFLSPCTLPILPAYFAFAFQGERTKIVVMTTAFFTGLATVFTLMGATASFIGSFIRDHMDAINIVGGSVIILFGLLSMVGRGFEGVRLNFQPARTLAGSFVFGATIAVGWTACVGPILASFLIMASTEDTVTRAMVLLFVYAMGLGLPLIIISALFKNLDKEGKFWQFIRGKGREFRLGDKTFLIHTTNIIAGLVLVLLGVLVMTGYLSHLNRIVPASIQDWLAGVEDALIRIFI